MTRFQYNLFIAFICSAGLVLVIHDIATGRYLSAVVLSLLVGTCYGFLYDREKD